jgi:cell shape-determining protein MreC
METNTIIFIIILGLQSLLYFFTIWDIYKSLKGTYRFINFLDKEIDELREYFNEIERLRSSCNKATIENLKVLLAKMEEITNSRMQ